MKTAIKSGELKHRGLIKKATSYTATGQASGWVTEFPVYLGINSQDISETDHENNRGNASTLYLFARYDVRLKNGQGLYVFGRLYMISQLDNVEFANQRLNFTATEL